jgi:hypothetical protein
LFGGERDFETGPEATAVLAGFVESGVAELVGMLQDFPLPIRGQGADGFQDGAFQGDHGAMSPLLIMLLSRRD